MLDWIKRVDALLVELNEKPHLKRVRAIPLPIIQEHLRTLLEDKTLLLTSSEKGWVKREEIPFFQKGSYVISLAPLVEPIFLSFDERALLRLVVPGRPTLSESVSEGFAAYLLVEIMHKIHTTKAIAPLSMNLQSEKAHLNQESYFQIDLALSGEKGQLGATLFFSLAFQESWNHYFVNAPLLPLSEREKEQLNVEVGVQLGESRLSLKELKSLKEGDFLLLDRCLYDPETKKGSVFLTLSNKPIFRAKVKDGALKLVDYPLYEEVDLMNDEEYEDYEDEDEDEEYEDYEDEDEDEDEDDDSSIKEEEELFVEDGSEEKLSSEIKEAPKESVQITESSIEEIDLTVVVEVCRIRMSAKELLELNTGKVLNLDVPIEKAVTLVVNDKCFGRAELMRIGDTLGVRILQLIGK